MLFQTLIGLATLAVVLATPLPHQPRQNQDFIHHFKLHITAPGKTYNNKYVALDLIRPDYTWWFAGPSSVNNTADIFTSIGRIDHSADQFSLWVRKNGTTQWLTHAEGVWAWMDSRTVPQIGVDSRDLPFYTFNGNNELRPVDGNGTIIDGLWFGCGSVWTPERGFLPIIQYNNGKNAKGGPGCQKLIITKEAVVA